jgi:hypothetical protein
MPDYDQEWENYRRRRNLKLFLLIGYVPITFAFGLITTAPFHTDALIGVFAILWILLSLYVVTHNNMRCPRCGKWFCFDRN